MWTSNALTVPVWAKGLVLLGCWAPSTSAHSASKGSLRFQLLLGCPIMLSAVPTTDCERMLVSGGGRLGGVAVRLVSHWSALGSGEPVKVGPATSSTVAVMVVVSCANSGATAAVGISMGAAEAGTDVGAAAGAVVVETEAQERVVVALLMLLLLRTLLAAEGAVVFGFGSFIHGLYSMMGSMYGWLGSRKCLLSLLPARDKQVHICCIVD